MRNLIPTFILDQMAQGNRAGSLPAVVLFVDTSGFTPLTAALMQHGAEGAEIVAGVLDAVFRIDTGILWFDTNDNGALDADDLHVQLQDVSSLRAADVLSGHIVV